MTAARSKKVSRLEKKSSGFIVRATVGKVSGRGQAAADPLTHIYTELVPPQEPGRVACVAPASTSRSLSDTTPNI